ncbi:DUF2029 domain-containing protein [Streptomyces sp. MST-110588]|nr:DUF2029 domain-containing protein [Streptomyces sp. MST-110588]
MAAVWAAGMFFFSALETHRVWGLCAMAGYGCAAIAARCRPSARSRTASVVLALAGAVVLPLLFLVLTGRAQSEVTVIERSGLLTLHQVTPYLADPRTVDDYTPYLPGMALLGIPRALLGEDGWVARLVGDARIWCASVFLLCLHHGRRVLRRPDPTGHAGRGRLPYGTAVAALVASPVVALPLCVSGVDLPLTGLCVLALALAACGRPGPAGFVLAAACSLKWTAWPALAVAVALLGHAHGVRAALRCAGVTVAGTLVLVLPGVLLSPGAMVQQVLAFPTGRGAVPTPADSLLPGRLLAGQGALGWYVAVGALALAALAVAAWLVLRPPAGLVAAADRLALGLSAGFALAPAGRFGYLALPVVLALWARLATAGRRTPGSGPVDLPRTTGHGRLPRPLPLSRSVSQPKAATTS